MFELLHNISTKSLAAVEVPPSKSTAIQKQGGGLIERTGTTP